MKAKYLSLAALALVGALASCQSDDEATTGFRPDNAVSLNFSVGSLQATTRSNAVATDDTQSLFNEGDQISVSTNDQEAVLFQCTSSDDQTWTEAVAGKFLLWTQNTLTFSAYYPATAGTSMTAFNLPTDQSSVDKIALADYMTKTAEIERPASGSDIQMQLERKMARVIVRISGFGSQYDDDEKTVSNVSIYSEASGIADGNPTGSSTEILPYAQGNGSQGTSYTALVVPGYGDNSADFIALTDGENNTRLVKGIPELEAGHSYTFNLTVGKNRILVQSVTVQDWTTGTTLAGGQATEAPASDNPAPTTASIEDYTAGTFGWDGDGSAATNLPTINTFAANDEISILSAKNTNTKFTTSAGGASATFSGTATDDSKFYAVYPYTDGLALSGDVISGIVIPTSQWNSGWNSGDDFSGWDPKAPIAYATTTGSSLTFQNACAILKVTFPFANFWGRFTISANEPLAGTFSLDTSTGTLTPTSGSTTVTVGTDSYDSSGISTYSSGKTVYVAIAPGTYTGFNLHIYNEWNDDNSITKSGSVTFEAGKIYDLGSYDLGTF